MDAAALEQAVARDATEFANDLSEDPTLSELGGIPLLLSVMIYLRLTGRVLPNSRLAALEELVKALLEDQPRHAPKRRCTVSTSRRRVHPVCGAGLSISLIAFTKSPTRSFSRMNARRSC